MKTIRLLSIFLITLGLFSSAAYAKPHEIERQDTVFETDLAKSLRESGGDVLRRQGGSIGAENQARSEAEARAGLEAAKAACETGDVNSCQAAGVKYKDGTGTTPDPGQARAYFERSCNGGRLQGCNDLAYLLARGDGGSVDMVRAKALLAQACAGDLQMACFNSAFLLISSDPNRAIALYRRACERGWHNACYNLAAIYSDGVLVARDTVLARLYYRRTCDGGVMRGCDALSIQDENARLEARNGTKPVEQIVAELERDCANRKARACNDLGMRVFEAEGAMRDWFRAADLFKRACEEDSMIACFNLGTLYSQGQGVQRDMTAAAALYLRACDGRNQLSCQTLAELYLTGEGVNISPPKAVELFERLCGQGRALSCISLANFHESHAAGKGAAEALRWFEAALALDATNPQARLGINRLRPGLDARQRCLPNAHSETATLSARALAPNSLLPSGRDGNAVHTVAPARQPLFSQPVTSVPAATGCAN